MRLHIIQGIILSLIAGTVMNACTSSNDHDEPPTPAAPTRTVSIVAVDYNPAPGQFVNEMPVYAQDMTPQQVQEAAMAALLNGRGISLGAFGGYVIIQLGETITHRADGKDFKVLGNAFRGSAEPGVVEVSSDGQHWHALAGDDWDKAERNFTITYHRPIDNATPQQYIRWTSDNGYFGWISRNPGFHTEHSYFPEWIDGQSTMTFTAIRIPSNWTIETASGNYFGVARAGYADSYPNSADESWLNLANAVDDAGRKVQIDNVNYIKVTTGVINSNIVTGECSTEVMGIQVPNE